MSLTFLLPVVSLSRVSIPPLNDTGERVPSTDSSRISLNGLAGTLECKGVDVREVVGLLPDMLVMVASASELNKKFVQKLSKNALILPYGIVWMGWILQR